MFGVRIVNRIGFVISLVLHGCLLLCHDIIETEVFFNYLAIISSLLCLQSKCLFRVFKVHVLKRSNIKSSESIEATCISLPVHAITEYAGLFCGCCTLVLF